MWRKRSPGKGACFLGKRFGASKVKEGPFVHVGMVLAQGKDFSATSTHADFAKKLKLLPTSPEIWDGRKEPLSTDYIELRQSKLGRLRWVATASRPDIAARSARLA